MLADYLQYGGMPGLFELGTRNRRSIGNELSAIYQAIVYRDVAQRFGIRDLAGLNRLGRFLSSAGGSLFSARNMANTLTSVGHAANGATVSNMIHALEQADLQGRGWQVHVGTGRDCEIDFVAEVPYTRERAYLQVSADLRNEETRKRELAPLRKLHDSFPRIVITLDRFSVGQTQEGIRIIHAVDWLLKKRE